MMKLKRKNSFLKPVLVGVILLFCTNIYAQQGVNLKFSDWDKDDNGIISRTEFVNLFTTVYIDDWNKIDDAHLDDEDFYQISYDVWDKDDDQRLSKEEWMYSQQNSDGVYAFQSIEAVDADGDGYIQPTEYYNILDQTDYFPDWDTNSDRIISELELAKMVFNHWDSDESNVIEQDEYEEFDDYFLDF